MLNFHKTMSLTLTNFRHIHILTLNFKRKETTFAWNLKLVNMIQRIQSLYLSLIFLFSLVFIRGSYLNFTDKAGSVIKITFSSIVRDSGLQGITVIEELIPVAVIILLIPLLSLITIFLYKNRKLQMRFSAALIILIAAFILVSLYYSWFIITNFGAALVPGLKMVVIVIILILAILAHIGIRKDDNLIKSYDRLR